MMKNIQFKKASIFIILILFIGLSLFPSIQSGEFQKDPSMPNNKAGDQIPILKQMGPVGSYEDYLKSIEDKSFILQKISESLRKNSPLVIVFVESDIVSDILDELILYNETLISFGYSSVIFQVSGVTPEDLKDQIIEYWDGGYNVTGAVLIGDLPTEWFHHENDFYGSSEFPCDLFLMDLDGTWIDTDYDGMYDSHTNGSGDTAPEIYIGRIDTSNVPGDEIINLKKYFAKVNDFWTGVTNLTQFGLTYTDQDWASYESFRYDLSYAYDDIEAIWYPDVNRNDYVNNRIPDEYEFIQLSCHSSSQGHAFTDGGWAYNNDIRNAPPRALFYNLFACSSLRFTDDNCLGYAYILDTDTPSLTVVGSAKTGSMLDFQYFYEPIGEGSSFGTAFRKWFEYEYPYSDDPEGYNDVSWFYGMTILGDPTLIIKKPENNPPYGGNITGPNFGTKGEEYTFCIDVYDSEEDSIYCMWDWGDGNITDWLGPYSSGEIACISHSWIITGDFDIRVKLKDSLGLESQWSESYPITIVEGPILDIQSIKGGMFKVSVGIKNIGAIEATNVKWNMTLNGGLILFGKENSGEISSILAGEEVEVNSQLIFGFGKTRVIVKAEMIEGASDTREQSGFLLLFFITVNPGDSI